MTLRLNFAEFCARSGTSSEELINIERQLIALAGNQAWLAGGAVRRTLIGHALDSDFDLFFSGRDALDAFQDAMGDPIKETKHHKQWKWTPEGSQITLDIQAIMFRFYDSPDEVIDSFDYTITQFALEKGDLITTPQALWDLGRKRLAIHKVTYPVATMRRMLKYTRQGFTACSGCMATLLRETVNSPDALEEMDVHYVD